MCTSHTTTGNTCGKVLKDISAFPGEKKYEEGSVIYNQAYADIKPSFIAFPETVKDVQRCLQCSAANAVPCVVKSGGHSSAGYSTIDGSGFVINLAEMSGVNVSDDNLVVQAGAIWSNVYEKIDSSLLVTGGACPSVGVAGYTLGGGYGILDRKYGLAIDNVISMVMVTVSGDRVVVASDISNPDLFWALRGGGGGNFGIVTEIAFKIHKATYSNYVLGSLSYEAGTKSQSALDVIGRISLELPREMYLDLAISSNKELHIFSIYLGSYEDAVDYLKPITDIASEVSFTNYSSYYALAHQFSGKGGYDGHISNGPEVLSGCVIDIDEKVADIMFTSNIPEDCVFAFMHLGGQINETPPTATSYYHRKGEFYTYIPCNYNGKEEEEEVLQFQYDFFNTLRQDGYCLGYYVNDIDKHLVNWQEKYYGDNYPRLLEIKNLWNPIGTGYFHFPQEIGSNYQYSDYCLLDGDQCAH